MEKVLVDTNLVLRLFVDGDDELPKLAEDKVVWITNEVFFETVFSLQSFYKMDRTQIFDLMSKLMMRKNIESNRTILMNTLIEYRNRKNLSLIDCFLFNLARDEGLELITNDKDLAKLARIVS